MPLCIEMHKADYERQTGEGLAVKLEDGDFRLHKNAMHPLDARKDEVYFPNL